MRVSLTVIKGPNPGRVIEFTHPRGFLIGRAHDADYRLPEDDPYVSRRHVYLEIAPPACRIQNLSTTNPAYVGGELVDERELRDGDVLELGYTRFRVAVLRDPPPPAHRCAGCGAVIELAPGETPPARCPACVAAGEVAARAARAAEVYRVRCTCGADLAARANSDGRAIELADAATYVCERCVPRPTGAADSLGPYELLRTLGEGGMGTVYLAYEPATARLVAVKVMRELRELVLVKRFEREVRLQKTLVHPNVVRCLDTCLDAQGKAYLVTEYVPDGSLDDAVEFFGGRLPVDAAVALIDDVLAGLEYIHAQQVIHRDIKPPNILLRGSFDSGRRPTAKVADFGLALSFARAGGTRLTRKGTGMGTLIFMPPEQVRDASSVREPADTYAVGVTLYYLLTGRFTFDFPTPADVAEFARTKPGLWKRPHEALKRLMHLRRIMHPFQIVLREEPIAIHERDPTISPQLASVVDRAVRKDPAERFPTAATLRAALRQVLT